MIDPRTKQQKELELAILKLLLAAAENNMPLSHMLVPIENIRHLITEGLLE